MGQPAAAAAFWARPNKPSWRALADGIVIAANRLAKKFGIKTGTACFKAKRLCPSGVLCRPHYDAYRELSRQMFLILEEYAPTLVPYSIDEGFLDFSTMDWGRMSNMACARCCEPAAICPQNITTRQRISDA